jgi:hypothetical protein
VTRAPSQTAQATAQRLTGLCSEAVAVAQADAPAAMQRAAELAAGPGAGPHPHPQEQEPEPEPPPPADMRRRTCVQFGVALAMLAAERGMQPTQPDLV